VRLRCPCGARMATITMLARRTTAFANQGFIACGPSPRVGYSDFAARQTGQYHGAGVVTGFGLLRRQRAQRKRLPLMAVFGRDFLPVLGMLFGNVRFRLHQAFRLTNDPRF
jgi:hypothetical protein